MKLLAMIGQPQRHDQEHAELDQHQRRQPQAAEHDRDLVQRIEQVDRGVSSWPRMLKAAISQADSDTTRTMKALLITEVNSRITSHAKASLADTASR